MRLAAPMQSALEPKSYAIWRTPKGTFRRLRRFIRCEDGARRQHRQLPPIPMEVFMSKWMLAAATATLICASSSAVLADQAGAVTGGVAGAVGGAVIGGPVGAVVGGVGGAAIGSWMTNHHHYYHHAYYHHHYYHHY